MDGRAILRMDMGFVLSICLSINLFRHLSSSICVYIYILYIYIYIRMLGLF